MELSSNRFSKKKTKTIARFFIVRAIYIEEGFCYLRRKNIFSHYVLA